MPAALTYPGVYIEEIPSGVRTITGVATSITAFIGRARRGPTNKAEMINSFADFERIFGGLWLQSMLGYAVRDFYLNGGSQAIIVRLFHPDFVDEKERASAEAAAQAVADVAKGAADVATAKTAADSKRDQIKNDNTKTSAEKQAAEAVAATINAVVNTTPKPDMDKIADAAVKEAAPHCKAKLSVGDVNLEAASEGTWGASLRSSIDLENISDPNLFNLTVYDSAPGGFTERFLNLSIAKDDSRRMDKALEAESKLVRWDGKWPDTPPNLNKLRDAAKALDDASKANPVNQATVVQKQDALWQLTQDTVTLAESKYARAKKTLEDKQNTGSPDPDNDAEKTAVKNAKDAVQKAQQAMLDAVSDGSYLTVNDFLPPNSKTQKRGMHALEQAALFNLLCIPPYKVPSGTLDVDVNLISAAATYCEERRAMLLVDSPKDWKDKSSAKEKFTDPSVEYVGTRSKNAALFFPRLRQPNPLRDNQMEEFAACGAVAGVFARTDTQRGVWKAPAGQEAALVGVSQLSVPLTDAENGELNPLGINCLRAFPVHGRLIWGSRTLAGADQLASEWKYIPVRRMALFIEQTLYVNLKWVVFEPNDESLWAQIRLNVGAFMHNLFRQGAFQGSTPRDAYFVKCDKETTPQNDINLGIVNIAVGFAPLKPAEFVVIQIQQMAGQIQA